MRLNIGGFEVEIIAKGKYTKRFNRKDTLQFLNKISLLASVAEAHYTKEGYKGLADEAAEVGDDIYNFCGDNGLYKF